MWQGNAKQLDNGCGAWCIMAATGKKPSEEGEGLERHCLYSSRGRMRVSVHKGHIGQLAWLAIVGLRSELRQRHRREKSCPSLLGLGGETQREKCRKCSCVELEHVEPRIVFYRTYSTNHSIQEYKSVAASLPLHQRHKVAPEAPYCTFLVGEG